MISLKSKAQKLINEFKGTDYIYGVGCLDRTGELVSHFTHTSHSSKNVLLITSLHKRDPESYDILIDSLKKQGLDIVGHTDSSRPNSPKEDVFRMKEAIQISHPHMVIVASGGSGIDAAKAAIVLANLGGDIEDYFGMGMVSEKLKASKNFLLPCIAIQTASGSAAHLTKYSNITDLKTFQKKLIVDEAIVPQKCLFDYSLTKSMSPEFTKDGAFDGLAHCLEVYYGALPENYAKVEKIALTGIELILSYLEKAINDPMNIEAREALGLATDLGGYAIMVGGTNGAHLTSFSLVDILSHGRACAILNPFYTVFFAPAIKNQLKQLATLFLKYDLLQEDPSRLNGKELGIAVANGLIALSKRVGFPTTLSEIKGMTQGHIDKAIQAAKNPQLQMKLKNMPVPLDADLVDEYMRPVLQSAMTGDFNLIKNFK